jgi:SpoIID/LytB domain protein
MAKIFPRKILLLSLSIVFLLNLIPEGFSEAIDQEYADLYQARVLFNLGQYKKAIEQYDKTAVESRYYKTALLNKALIYKDTTQYNKAVATYQQLLRLSPNKVIYKNLGLVYYLNAQPDHAISAFTQALKMGERDPMIYYWIARSYEDKNDRKNAVWAYEQTIKRDDEFAQAHFDLAMIYLQENLFKQAQDELEKAKELDPSIPRLNSFLGLVNFKQNNYDQALTYYKKEKAVSPEDKTVQKQIDIIYKKAGKSLEKQLAKRQKDRIDKSQAKMVRPNDIDAPMVKVHIGDLKRLRFKSATDFVIMDLNRSVADFKGVKDTLYTLSAEDNKIVLADDRQPIAVFDHDVVINNQDFRSTLLIFDIEAGTGQYWASKTDRIYRGQIIAGLKEGGLIQLINYLNMEEYLYGVLPSEMPNDWPEQALKAQAVAARSEAFRKMGRHKEEGFDFCSEVHCQAYNGAKVETKRTNRAVDQTSGQVATYKGKPIDAVYSNSCGGHTQGNIFGDRTLIEYWHEKQDAKENLGFYFPISALELEDWLSSTKIKAFCNNTKFSRRSNFRWMRTYTYKQLQEMISRKYNIGRLLSIEIAERNPSSHIHKINIVGTKGRFTVEKELNIRNLFANLRSAMFNINVKLDKKSKPEEYIFYGGGWGHGVGMCQVGAASMADQGFDYQDILHFYYSNIQIEKMY